MRASRFGFVILLLIAGLVASGRARAQSVDELSALRRQAQQLFGAGKYADALDRQRALVASTEKNEKGSAGAQTADALGILSWYALCARKFDEALAAAERAHALAPGLLWIDTN